MFWAIDREGDMVYIGDVHSKPLVTGVVSDINCTHLEASTVLLFLLG